MGGRNSGPWPDSYVRCRRISEVPKFTIYELWNAGLFQPEETTGSIGEMPFTLSKPDAAGTRLLTLRGKYQVEVQQSGAFGSGDVLSMYCPLCGHNRKNLHFDADQVGCRDCLQLTYGRRGTSNECLAAQSPIRFAKSRAHLTGQHSRVVTALAILQGDEIRQQVRREKRRKSRNNR